MTSGTKRQRRKVPNNKLQPAKSSTQPGVKRILNNKIQSGKSNQKSTVNPSKLADTEPSDQAQLHAKTLAREMGYGSIHEAIKDGKYADLYPTLPLPLNPLSNQAMLPIVGQAAIDDPEAFKASTHLCAAVTSKTPNPSKPDDTAPARPDAFRPMKTNNEPEQALLADQYQSIAQNE